MAGEPGEHREPLLILRRISNGWDEGVAAVLGVGVEVHKALNVHALAGSGVRVEGAVLIPHVLAGASA